MEISFVRFLFVIVFSNIRSICYLIIKKEKSFVIVELERKKGNFLINIIGVL